MTQEQAQVELERLRQIEAREVVVANTIVCILEVAEKPTKQGFGLLFEHLSKFDEQLSQAVEGLARRDYIRKLEGSVEALTVPGMLLHSAEFFSKRLAQYQSMLADAKTWTSEVPEVKP